MKIIFYSVWVLEILLMIFLQSMAYQWGFKEIDKHRNIDMKILMLIKEKNEHNKYFVQRKRRKESI